MKLTLNQHGVKHRIQIAGSDQHLEEMISVFSDLLVCAGYDVETVRARLASDQDDEDPETIH